MDTEVKAVGNTPEIGENGNWFIDGEDTGYPAVARDGVTPTVGENGNWWLGDLDTGVPAKGQDGEKGEDGKDGTVAAGIDGAQINEEGDLILTLADGTTINAGRVRDDQDNSEPENTESTPPAIGASTVGAICLAGASLLGIGITLTILLIRKRGR